MAHEISNVGFGDEVFTAGKPAWHGLGQNVREAVTSVEAMALAGLNWKVETSPIQLASGEAVPAQKATFRRDAQGKPVVLGVVGEGYVPVQNSEAFNFMDGLIGEGQAAYETAGAIKQGRRVWMLVRIPGDIQVGSAKDVTRKYLLLANAHDGTMALRAFFTPVRVVCNNTLTAALSSRKAGDGISIHHTTNALQNLDEARRVLGLAVNHYIDLGRAFNRFFKEAMTDGEAKAYFSQVTPDNDRAKNKSRTENIRLAMFEGFKRGRGADLAGNTLWGAYNAATEYADHTRYETEAGRRKAQGDDRMESLIFGSGRALKDHAFQVAREWIGAAGN